MYRIWVLLHGHGCGWLQDELAGLGILEFATASEARAEVQRMVLADKNNKYRHGFGYRVEFVSQ